MKEFSQIVLSLFVYILVAGAASSYYYHFDRKALLGGFWGGLLVGIIGAVIITLLCNINDWFVGVVYWLMVPKINGEFYFRVNIISAVIGAFLFVAILNLINHKRER